MALFGHSRPSPFGPFVDPRSNGPYGTPPFIPEMNRFDDPGTAPPVGAQDMTTNVHPPSPGVARAGGMFGGRPPVSLQQAPAANENMPRMEPSGELDPRRYGKAAAVLASAQQLPSGGQEPMLSGIPGIEDISGRLPATLDRRVPKAMAPKFFDRGGLGEKLARAAGEIGLMMSAGQGNPAAMAMLQSQMAAQRQRLQDERDDVIYKRSREDKIADWQRDQDAMQYFMSGEDRWSFDPKTGQGQRLVDAPQAWQEYATELGGDDPSDPIYQRHAQDFVLRGNGPTAFDYDSQLEGVRQGNREQMEGIRQGNRINLRGIPQVRSPGAQRSGGGGGNPNSQSAVVGGVLRKVASGQQLSPGEAQIYNRYINGTGGRGRGGAPGKAAPPGASGGGAPQVAVGSIRRNKSTGERQRWNGSSWVRLN